MLLLFVVVCECTHCGETLLVPQRSNDESDEPAFHKPAKGQFGAEGEKVTHLIQVQWTLARHRDKR